MLGEFARWIIIIVGVIIVIVGNDRHEWRKKMGVVVDSGMKRLWVERMMIKCRECCGVLPFTQKC